MSFDKNSPQPLKVRALKALAASDIEPDARSAITERGDVLFLSDSSEADARGAEFIFAFPSERVPETLDMETEFLIDGRPILAGVTTTEFYANKQLLTPTSEWTTLCEDLCERYAYVERSIALSGERRLSRRFFLAYNESFMLIFDELDGTSLDAKSVPQFRARSVFPFNTARNVQTDAEVREIALVRRATKFPKKQGCWKNWQTRLKKTGWNRLSVSFLSVCQSGAQTRLEATSRRLKTVWNLPQRVPEPV